MFLVIFNSLLYVTLLYLIIDLSIEDPDIKNNSIGCIIIYLYNIALLITGYAVCFLLAGNLKISVMINVFINIISLFFVIFFSLYDSSIISIWIVLFAFYLYFKKEINSLK